LFRTMRTMLFTVPLALKLKLKPGVYGYYYIVRASLQLQQLNSKLEGGATAAGRAKPL
jgi:hypothetical protein